MRSIIRTLVTFLVLVLLGGCLSEHPLKVGSNQWPGYEPVYLARDLGLLSSDQVKLVELPSSTDVMQYLRNGLLDAGMLTLDETISLINDGVKLDVALVMDISDGADSVLAQQDIRSLADIKGQKVGVELNAVGAVMLNALLEAAQLPRDSVRVVNTPVDQSIQAFRQRKIDVLITFEPFRRELLSGGAHEIFNSRRIPGAIIDVLAVRHDALQHHSGHLKELISAYFSARRHMKKEPEDAYTRMAPRLGIDATQLAAMYKGLKLPTLEQNRQWLNSGLLDKRAQKLMKLMKEWQLIEATPDISHLANASFLPTP